MSWSYNPNIAVTTLVWAIPRSLATTSGITFVFFSSGYLDVSVLRVCSISGDISSICRVAPFGYLRINRVCASNHSFSQLITSFFASESLGIPHTPLLSLLYFLLFIIFNIFLSKINFLILVSLLSQYVNELFQLLKVDRGEYRSRTDDLLRARQAL